MAFANPFDFELISKSAEETLFKYSYNRSSLILMAGLSLKLIDYVKRHEHVFRNDSRLDLDKIVKCTSWRELDEHLLIKCFDYQSAEEYYRDGSSRYYVPKIRIPYLICNSADDPFIPYYSITIDEVRFDTYSSA
jgi:predicted alpha/beta-fold hydrolase